MAERIAITASGIVSALGLGKKQHLEALIAGKSPLTHPRFLKTMHASEFVMGEVDRSDEALSQSLELPPKLNGYTRTTLLALTAMRELLNTLPQGLLQKDRFAFINSNSVGGMCSVENYYLDFISDNTSPEAFQYIDTLECAESTMNVAAYFGLKPFMATISTACSSSANALILGARLIRSGKVEKAICGGCDAMSRFTVNGFLSLKNVDKNPCRPFDRGRNGLNLGEGAGFLLLEKESDARERGAEIMAFLEGYSNSNDAYHPTAPSPDGSGAYRTMKQALEMAKLKAGDIGYINTHGTATLSNDLAEGLAIEKLFGANPPFFSSTKPFTGHTLAAAGVVEAIFSIWAMQEEVAFPNLNFEHKMEELRISPVTKAESVPGINYVLSNSFGFGGNNVSLVFSKK